MSECLHELWEFRDPISTCCDCQKTSQEIALEAKLEEAHSVNRIAALHVTEVEAEIKRLKTLLASDVHSCHDLCKRPMCVLRRELREAAELHAVQAKTIRDMEELMDAVLNRFYNHEGGPAYDAMAAYRSEEK